MSNSARKGALWCSNVPYDGPTEWLITEDTTWEVPVTGLYQLDIRGGGGSGGGGYHTTNNNTTYHAGGGGGQSRHVEEFELVKGDSYKITIGTGGTKSSRGGNGYAGESTAFGELITVEGANGGFGGVENYGRGGSGAGNSGAAGSQGGSTRSFSGDATGGAGGGVAGEYGSGGKGGDFGVGPGTEGSNGAVYITYLG